MGGYTLSTISDTVINMYASRVKKESKSSNLSLIGRFRSQSLRNSIDDEQIQTDQTDSLADDIKTVLGDLAPFLLFIFMCAIYIGSVEGWSIITSIYFCVVTATSGEKKSITFENFTHLIQIISDSPSSTLYNIKLDMVMWSLKQIQ